jgi:hypothetical protein
VHDSPFITGVNGALYQLEDIDIPS